MAVQYLSGVADSAPQPCDPYSTLAMPPATQLNSLKTPTKFATLQG